MKSEPSQTSGNRFHAPVRHYHRINTQKQTSWDEWIHGIEKESFFSPKNLRRWLKITGSLLAIITIIAIAVALYIELAE